jgi:hypothetical protein
VLEGLWALELDRKLAHLKVKKSAAVLVLMLEVESEML